jgi:rod shape-determining protein MreC
MQRGFFSPKIVKFLIISAICFLLIFLNPKGVFSPVRVVFFEVAYPFQKTFYAVSRTIAESASFLASIGAMRGENEKLLRENDALLATIVGLQEAKKENDVLREQLNLLPRDKFNLEPSFIIGQDPQGLGSWITIGKGSSEGIQPGMPVIVSDGILVGKVEEVSLDSSKVSLLTNSVSAVNASDLETGAKGLVKGTYGLGMVMDMISQADILNVGDTIITSGLGGGLPRGLLIGKIQEIKISPDKLFQQAIIMPRVRYQKLDIVFVIKD